MRPDSRGVMLRVTSGGKSLFVGNRPGMVAACDGLMYQAMSIVAVTLLARQWGLREIAR
jgi:hypothetical protein